MAQRLRMFLLDGPRLEWPDGQPLTYPGHKAAALLTCLGLAPGQRMVRSDLVGLLWDDLSSTSAARHALRQCLLRLRSGLGPLASVLVADPEALWLEPGSVEVDLVQLRRALAQGDAAQMRDLSERLGDGFCNGLEIKSPAFDNWLRQQRAEAERLCARLYTLAADDFATSGQMDQAIAAARRRLTVEPYEEAAHAALIDLNLRAGRRQAAVTARDDCIALFQRDLDVMPGQAVQFAIRAGSARPAAVAPVIVANAPAPPARRKFRAGLVGALMLALLLQGKLDPPASPDPDDPVGQPAMTPWISAVAAKTPRAADDPVSGDAAQRAAIRKMLQGDADYAMLYPVGC